MDNDIIELSTEIMQVITPEQAWHYFIIPRSLCNGNLEFYCENSCDINSITEELEMLFNKRVTLHQLPNSVLRKSLSKYYLRKQNGETDNEQKTVTQSLVNSSSDQKQKDFLHSLIEEANSLQCSDIHIERYENSSRIRFRMDGRLFERYIIAKDDYPTLINKIKILANLDIAEKRLPQDGRILFKNKEKNYDIRVSVIPGLHGEKIVLRLLNNSASDIRIEDIGFSSIQLNDYLESIKRPNGIILISGPTGSGKTTTLYATLNILNKKEVNILTIEDPIEYTIDGINQVQLKENIGLTFGRALKTFLRQDPDIIMVGEVRDTDTAQMAIRAALTGHLVLSTIHTNSAWGIVSRLIDMGLPPFLLASTLNVAVAQRLVRKICGHCKTEEEVEEGLIPRKYKDILTNKKHLVPVGCEHCHGSGYSGRVAVFEVINIDKDLRDLVRKSEVNADSILKEKGIQTLATSVIDLYQRGVTSFEEIYPILQSNF
jgi:type IV pilus assembly protein PilB